MMKMITVGEKAADAIKSVMEIEKINQTMLAEKMNYNRQAVQQSLNRRVSTMRVETMRRMIEAMGWKIVLVHSDEMENRS